MKSFKKFISEGSTEAAKEMEFVLVHAAGGEQISKYSNLKKYSVANGFEDPLDLGRKIINDIGKMAATGVITKKKWSDGTPQWLGSNKTPKTDIILGGKKVSLKKGSSQLMSGGPSESLSTFRTAMENTKNFNLEGIAKEVEDGIKNLLPSTVGEFMGGVDLQKQGGTVFQDTRRRKGKIGDVAAGTFDKDIIKRASARKRKNEAMTGAVKFDSGDASADTFLVVDFDGTSEMHEVKSSSDRYVSEILAKVNPDVKFKTSAVKKKIDGKNTKTGHYRFWSTVGLGYNAAVKNLKNSYDDYEKGILLKEGFFDRVKSIFQRFVQFLTKLFNAVRKFITKSANNMMEFLHLKPVINFKNDIEW